MYIFVRKADNAVHRMSQYHYPAGNVVFIANIYPLDSDLSAGSRYPAFKQLGLETNAPRSEYTMRHKDKCCRSLQSITRKKESWKIPPKILLFQVCLSLDAFSAVF